MNAVMPEHEFQKGNAASALPTAVQRSEQPDDDGNQHSAIKELDPNDTTSIRHGAAGLTNKALAVLIAQNSSVFAQYELALKEKEKREEQEALELAHLAEWNTQVTVVGGVSMTNGEAQEARRRVLENGDAYADWAAKNGHIDENEKDSFKQRMKRKIELEDRRGRGINTADDDKENAAIDQSRVGQALDKATAYDHMEYKRSHDAAANLNNANTALRSEAPAPVSSSAALFQGNRDDVIKPVAVDAEQIPVAPRVKSTGLNL